MGLTETESAILLNMDLFEGIEPQQLDAILSCLNFKKSRYKKGEAVTVSGGAIDAFGVVLEGTVQILKDDVTGRQSILSAVGPGETFAEVFLCAGIKKSPVTVIAATRASVIFLDYERVVRTCTSACAFHSRLIQNMLRVLAQKNLLMNNKISYLLLKSMRRKLAAYLIEQYGDAKSARFSIPFSRGELADFLNVDRSAMSRELCRMRDEGLIAFQGSAFSITDPKGLFLAV